MPTALVEVACTATATKPTRTSLTTRTRSSSFIIVTDGSPSHATSSRRRKSTTTMQDNSHNGGGGLGSSSARRRRGERQIRENDDKQHQTTTGSPHSKHISRKQRARQSRACVSTNANTAVVPMGKESAPDQTMLLGSSSSGTATDQGITRGEHPTRQLHIRSKSVEQGPLPQPTKGLPAKSKSHSPSRKPRMKTTRRSCHKNRHHHHAIMDQDKSATEQSMEKGESAMKHSSAPDSTSSSARRRNTTPVSGTWNSAPSFARRVVTDEGIIPAHLIPTTTPSARTTLFPDVMEENLSCSAPEQCNISNSKENGPAFHSANTHPAMTAATEAPANTGGDVPGRTTNEHHKIKSTIEGILFFSTAPSPSSSTTGSAIRRTTVKGRVLPPPPPPPPPPPEHSPVASNGYYGSSDDRPNKANNINKKSSSCTNANRRSSLAQHNNNSDNKPHHHRNSNRNLRRFASEKLCSSLSSNHNNNYGGCDLPMPELVHLTNDLLPQYVESEKVYRSIVDCPEEVHRLKALKAANKQKKKNKNHHHSPHKPKQ